jgi:hypothetical protein
MGGRGPQAPAPFPQTPHPPLKETTTTGSVKPKLLSVPE